MLEDPVQNYSANKVKLLINDRELNSEIRAPETDNQLIVSPSVGLVSRLQTDVC